MRHLFAFILTLVPASPLLALPANAIENTVEVVGIGKISTPPDIAVIDYWVAGEGRTPDEASKALVATRTAIAAQLGAVLDGRRTATDGELTMAAVRGPHCDSNPQFRLSEGDCAIIGYLARAQTTVRTSAVAKAGTAVGLASRLGARDARLNGYQLGDPRGAQRAAMTEAVLDARHEAEAIASAAGRRLGPILSMRDQNGGYRPVIVSGTRIVAAPPPPAPPPPPVEIDLSPRPIETSASVEVTFSLLP